MSVTSGVAGSTRVAAGGYLLEVMTVPETGS
jgi:hypothetical protein